MPTISLASPAERLRQFADEVRRDLRLTPKQLQSKYLYDALGSALFEAICQLPWYAITRAERGLLARHAPLIMARMRGSTTVIELGCGSGEKLALLLEGARGLTSGLRVHLVDISASALELTEHRLGRLNISTVGHRSTYEEGLRRAAARRAAGESMLVLFLGSNIGNFDPPAAADFLRQIRAPLRPGDALLLGVDLVKPEADLLMAYDDPLGVTAAFNKNLLVRLNAELGASFDLDAFQHRAAWNPQLSRVEMHLVSRVAHVVEIPAAGLTVHFDEGEWIWTESSYKYTPETIDRLAASSGFRVSAQWIEPAARFALSLLEPGNRDDECQE
jgi:dimethylhistidine N-methyltransferase